MTLHIPRSEVETAQEQRQLVDLIVETLAHTFAAEGPEQGLEKLRSALQSLDPSAVKALIYTLHLETEPPLEDAHDIRAEG
jgi:hypothetical protein